jgi:hypothetical protein
MPYGRASSVSVASLPSPRDRGQLPAVLAVRIVRSRGRPRDHAVNLCQRCRGGRPNPEVAREVDLFLLLPSPL